MKRWINIMSALIFGAILLYMAPGFGEAAPAPAEAASAKTDSTTVKAEDAHAKKEAAPAKAETRSAARTAEAPEAKQNIEPAADAAPAQHKSKVLSNEKE